MWDLIRFNEDTFCFTQLINKIKKFEEENHKVNYLVMSEFTLEDMLKKYSGKDFIKMKKRSSSGVYVNKNNEIVNPLVFNDKYYIAICNDIDYWCIHIV